MESLFSNFYSMLFLLVYVHNMYIWAIISKYMTEFTPRVLIRSHRILSLIRWMSTALTFQIFLCEGLISLEQPIENFS